jgi:hypothetical protein
VKMQLNYTVSSDLDSTALRLLHRPCNLIHDPCVSLIFVIASLLLILIDQAVCSLQLVLVGRPCLTVPVDTAECLILLRGFPPGTVLDKDICVLEIETDATCSAASKQNAKLPLSLGVEKPPRGGFPVLQRASNLKVVHELKSSRLPTSPSSRRLWMTPIRIWSMKSGLPR